MNALLKKKMWCDTTKDTDEVSDEYVEAAGPIFKAGEVFDKEIGATEDNTDIGEESQLVLRSKAEEMIDNEIGAADHKDAKGLVTLIIFPVSLTVLHLTWDLGNIT